MAILAVFLGGGIGSTSRYLLSKYINETASIIFPLGTLAVNVIGCFIIGVLFNLFDRVIVPGEIRLFLMTGFLGGFTTFSSLNLETVNLIQSNELSNAAMNIVVSIIIGLLFVFLGMTLVEVLLRKR